MKTTPKAERIPHKYSFLNVEPLRGLGRQFNGEIVGSKMLSDSRKRTDKIHSKYEKNYVLNKPLPYNLYNVNLAKDEVFQLQYK